MAIDLAQFHEMYFDECEEHCSRAVALLDQPGSVGTICGKLEAAIECLRLIKDGAQVFGFGRIVELTRAIEMRLVSLSGGAVRLDDPDVLEMLRVNLADLRGRIGLQRTAAYDVGKCREKGGGRCPGLLSGTSVADSPRRYLTFTRCGQSYAVATEAVIEVRDAADLERVPGAPDGVFGATRLDGRYVPVVDPRPGVRQSDRSDKEFLSQVIVSASGRAIALLVDAVEQILTPSLGSIRGADENRQIHGVLTIGDRSVKLIDIEGLMRSIGLIHPPAECEVG